MLKKDDIIIRVGTKFLQALNFFCVRIIHDKHDMRTNYFLKMNNVAAQAAAGAIFLTQQQFFSFRNYIYPITI